jgi:hypothetical protein
MIYVYLSQFVPVFLLGLSYVNCFTTKNTWCHRAQPLYVCDSAKKYSK